MIPSLALLAALALAQDAADDAPEEAPPADDDVLSPYRTRFEVLAERTIGTTSRPVEFNWRRTKAQIALSGSYLVELNNFNSMRTGALLRLPADGAIVEVGLSYVDTWDSPSSELLAYTPYRQSGRPDRGDVDVAIGMPLAEGIVTTFPRFFPAVQMVFVGYAGFRYHLYPSGFEGMKIGKIAGNALSPTLSDDEVANLELARLDAMEVDRGRYGLLLGLGNDLYFKSGFFVSPRMMMALPLLAGASRTELALWADLSLAVGVAF